MVSTVDEEARYLSGSESLADGRRRFSDIAGRVSELIIEKESEFWSAFVETYTSDKQAVDDSDKQAVHAQLAEEVKAFVSGKDQA